MADPIRFHGFNRRLVAAPDMTDVGTLHVFNDGRNSISCWKLDEDERKRVAETGEVWLSVQAGKTAPPVFVSGLPLMMATDPDSGDETAYHSDGRHVVNDARYFALLHHGDQMYGKEPYSFHLDGVVDVLRGWGADWAFLAAGYLHDLIEDCLQHLTMPERRAAVQERYGEIVLRLVWACTGESDDRAEAFAGQLAKIIDFPPAAIVKSADRLFNMRACLKDLQADPTSVRLQKLSRTYLGEMDDFVATVTPLVPPEVVSELQAAAAALQAFLSTLD